jgi:hypothetical protein
VRTFSTISSGALRAAAARPSSVAESRTAGAPAPQRFPAARPPRPADALVEPLGAAGGMILVILVGMAGLWLAGNRLPVGWTLVAVACLLWLPYALERQAADRESGCWSLGAASQRRIHAGLAVKPGRV